MGLALSCGREALPWYDACKEGGYMDPKALEELATLKESAAPAAFDHAISLTRIKKFFVTVSAMDRDRYHEADYEALKKIVNITISSYVTEPQASYV
jgi:hypothetical protein